MIDACTDHCLVLNRCSIEVQNGNFSVWWENKKRKDQFAISQNEKHRKEIQKLNQAAEQVSKWADKNERSKIGYDPIKENDQSISTRSFIGAKTKKMQSRVKQIEKLILEYQPTMLFVEHDKKFCEKIATNVVELE